MRAEAGYWRSRWRTGVATHVFVAAVAVTVASALQDDASLGNQIRQWADKLGAPAFADREAASRALAEIGAPARPALETAAKSADPEVRARARDLLANLRYGITTNTPPAMAALIKRYPTLSLPAQQDALSSLASGLKADAVPFFLYRAALGDDVEGRKIVEQMLLMKDTNAWRQVIAGIPRPSNPSQASLLAQACLAIGTMKDMSEAMKSTLLPRPSGRGLAEMALKRLCAADGGSAAERAEAAESLATTFADARFLYVSVAALKELGKDAEASQAAVKALEMNPEIEAPHFMAANLLEQLSLPELALKEWEKILAIPPQDDVYDINAWMRIGRLLSESDPGKAADIYERGLAAYRKAKARHGHGVGILGGSEADIEKKIRILRGEEDPADANPEPSPYALDLEMEATLAAGKEEDLAAARKASDGSLTMNVQPEGVRLFEEVPNTELRYDAKERAFNVLMNGGTCAQSMPFEARKKSLVVELQALDWIYFFAVDTETGKSQLTTKFQYDYVLKLKPGPGFKDWKDVVIRQGDKACDWGKAGEGIVLDYLPSTLQIQIEGTPPDGERKKLTYSYTFRSHLRKKKGVAAPKEAIEDRKGGAPEREKPSGGVAIDPRRAV